MDSAKLRELEADIRNSAGREAVETQLETSERIIARITDGIYREPWAAFRELIANAYDADASHVVVETGAPKFDQIIIRDDGIGMSPKTLAYILQNIGGSSKRTEKGVVLHTTQGEEHDKSPGGRLLIGKIGIGLFAVAQLTQHFQIITKASGEPLRISATVRLQTHNDDKFEDDYAAGTVTIKSEQVPDLETHTHGTSVILYQLRPEVKRILQSTRRWQDTIGPDDDTEIQQKEPAYHIGHLRADGEPHRPPLLPWCPQDAPETKFRKFLEAVSRVSAKGARTVNLEHFDEYLRLVWKLSLSLPIAYIGNHPFDINGSSRFIVYGLPVDSAQAERVNINKVETLRDRFDLTAGADRRLSGFSVTLDGIALRRPISLPTELAKKSRIAAPVIVVHKQESPFLGNVVKRAGGALAFEAYLYWNSQVIPKDIAGVLIRIREASGTLFDPTFLNYQVSEQTRLRQITAEVFIHEGLDGAVNIDRESFNYSHPHFLFLQRWLHRALRLTTNRLKAMATENLEYERVTRRREARAAIQERAEEIWHRRYGEDADSPTLWLEDGLPDEVGGVEVGWRYAKQPERPERAVAIAVVLEAYGLLRGLDVEDRAQVLVDIQGIVDLTRSQ